MPKAFANSREIRRELLQNVEAIMESWEQALRSRRPSETAQHSIALLRDSLPQLLTAIGISLYEASSDNVEPALENVAAAHAHLRASLGTFSLDAIVEEYSLFRSRIFAHLDSAAIQVSPRAREIIDRCVDFTIEIAVKEYVERTHVRTRDLERDREALARRLAQEQERLEAVLDQLPIGVSLSARPGGKILYHNKEAARILGHDMIHSPGVRGYSQYGALHPDGRPYAPEEYPIARSVLHGEVVREEEMLYRRGGGDVRWISVSSAPVRLGSTGESPLAVSVFWDIQEIKLLNGRLAREKEFAQVTLRSISDGVVTLDRAGRVTGMNPGAEGMLADRATGAQGEELARVLRLEDEDGEKVVLPVRESLESNTVMTQKPFVLMHGRDGRRAVSTTTAPMHDPDGEVIGAVVILHDRSHEWRLWDRLSREATEDPLTGLVNRREFERRLGRTVGDAQRGGATAALLMLDLDRFKQVNDVCGHAAGDRLLNELAELVQKQIRDRDTLARLGGDEFAIILEHCPPERALAIADAIREQVRVFEFACEGRVFSIGVSIGLLAIDDSSPDPHRAMWLADRACYAAKAGGRNRVCVAGQGMPSHRSSGPEISSPAGLESALEEDRMILFGQRIRALRPATESGADCVEVLVRLSIGDGRLLRPDRFLPAAERYDLMPLIDLRVVRKVIALLRQDDLWRHNFELCTINLSAQTLADPRAVDELVGVLAKAPGEAARLGFEIGEETAIRNLPRTDRVARRLRASGARLVLEDVGTSLVSFRHLRSLPVDMLKLEGSFVQNLATESNDRAIVRALIDVCHLLGKRTMAKWVSERGVLEELRALGVDFVQGYLVAPPESLDQVLRHH